MQVDFLVHFGLQLVVHLVKKWLRTSSMRFQHPFWQAQDQHSGELSG